MDITPATKVGALLDAHPGLEDVLIGAVPAFAKLRNPLLRATVAKVATLEQAAKVAGVPLPDLILRLRGALGQEGPAVGEGAPSQVLEAWPAWFREDGVTARLEVAAILAEGGHPLAKARQALAAEAPGAIVVLRSDFEPAPLLALVRQEGWLAACVRCGAGFETALRRP